jgi:tetratricopeptide (TPR) repeat protein
MRLCDIDTNQLRKDDMMAFFTLGVQEYLKKYYHLQKYIGDDFKDEYFPGTNDPFTTREIQDYSLSIWYFKKVIRLDKKNPLVYYYLGKVYFAQKQWEKAELMFRYAIENHLDTTAFNEYYFGILDKGASFPYPHKCFEGRFFGSQYPKIDNYYFLASLYESWQHFDEAESYYKKIIQEIPEKIEPYLKLWQLLEKQNRYTEAEDVIQSFSTYNHDKTNNELNAFYRRAIAKYPNAAEWNYKLGLLLYSLAQKKSLDCKTDTIIWFSKINKEVFLGSEGYSGNWTDLQEDLGRGVSYTGCGQYISVNQDSTEPTRMPATEEWLPLSRPIYYPRYDGIKYLKKAAELISVRELQGEINYKIGNMYIWAGSKKQAYPFLAKSLEFVPGNANTRLQIVDVCAATYRNRIGLEQLSFLYDSSQINFQNRLLFSEFAMYAGQFDKSKKLLNEAEAINPYPLTEITDLNGRLAFLSGKTNDAIAFYKAVLDERPDDMYACYSLARLYAGKKNNKEAFNWLSRAINKGFNYSFIFKYDPVMANLREKADWIAATKKIHAKDWRKTNESARDEF